MMADRKTQKENAELKQQIFFLTNLIKRAKDKDRGQLHKDNPPSKTSRQTYSYCQKTQIPTKANIKVDSRDTTVNAAGSGVSRLSKKANLLQSGKNVQIPLHDTCTSSRNIEPTSNKVQIPVQTLVKHEFATVKGITSDKPTLTSSIQNKILRQSLTSKSESPSVQPPTSLDLDKHSLASLKKILASRLEAKESRKSAIENNTKTYPMSTLAVKKNIGTESSTASSLAHNASCSNGKALIPSLKPVASILPKKKTVRASSSLNEQISVSSPKSSQAHDAKDEEIKQAPVSSVQDLSTLLLPTKGDLAKNLKSTEAKIKELTAELTKLKEVAKIVSSSPEKVLPKHTRKPSTQRSLHRFQTQSTSSPSTLSKRKPPQSTSQSAAKYIISKYRMKKIPVKKTHLSQTNKNLKFNQNGLPIFDPIYKTYKTSSNVIFDQKYKRGRFSQINQNPKFTKNGLPIFDTKYKTSKQSSHLIFDSKYKRFKKVYINKHSMSVRKRTSALSTRWYRPASAYIYSSPYKYGRPGTVKKQQSVFFKKQTNWFAHPKYRNIKNNKHVYVRGGNFSQNKFESSGKGLKDRSKTILVRGVRFQVGRKGKTLQRFDSKTNTEASKAKEQLKTISRIDYRGVTYVETKPGILEKISSSQSRWRASQSVQKSIVLSRHKQKKTERQYCMFFCRFGKCKRGDNCKFIHDPDKVAVCTRFLRGTCKIEKCPFSHKVSKDKMPVCSYFLRGLCVRENCPYLHVKVGENAKVCRGFLKGFCSKGEKCQEKHIRVCPEFTRTGQCSSGKKCPLEHRPKGRKRQLAKPSQIENTSVSQDTEVVIPSAGTSQQREGLEEEGSYSIPFKMMKLPAFISINSPEDDEPLQSKKSSPLKQFQEPLRIKPRL